MLWIHIYSILFFSSHQTLCEADNIIYLDTEYQMILDIKYCILVSAIIAEIKYVVIARLEFSHTLLGICTLSW